MVNRKLHPKKFFTQEEKNRIVRAIREAERETSGEIRVYLEHKSKSDTMTQAKKVFDKLGMTKTKHRNGVLIYFSLKQRSFVVLGDKGIHDHAGEGFWRGVASKMESSFRQDDFVGGLEAAIREMGAKLKTHFPQEAGDTNELPDKIEE